jgi:hypothetical protein
VLPLSGPGSSAGVCVEPAGTIAVCLLLFPAVFHAQEAGALCTAGGWWVCCSAFWALYFGPLWILFFS